MSDKPVYWIDAIADWDQNGRKGRGMNRASISPRMQRAAVLEPIEQLVQKHWEPNRRTVHLIAAKLYEWYRTHACPFPGVFMRHLDVRIIHTSSNTLVASIDVSSGGVVELCRFKS